MREFTRVMKALADPGRVKIVKMLQRRELCVCELQAALGLAQPTVSKHLKVLEDAGLVERRREGQWVNFCPAAAPGLHARTMLEHLAGRLEDDPDVAALLARLPDLDRNEICNR
jgi:ArsR family transcriptional regulator